MSAQPIKVRVTIEADEERYALETEVQDDEMLDSRLNSLYGAVSIKVHDLCGHLVSYTVDGGVHPVCTTCRDRQAIQTMSINITEC